MLAQCTPGNADSNGYTQATGGRANLLARLATRLDSWSSQRGEAIFSIFGTNLSPFETISNFY